MTALLNAPTTVGQPLVRPMTTDDYDDVARLEESEGLLSLPEDDWRALWLENPLWPALGDRWPLGWVLERGGALVGAVSNVPMRYVLGGRTLVAAAGRGWVVDPAYRGFALWLLDEYFNQDADLFFNTTVNGLADETFRSMGSARVPVGDWTRAAFRIARHGKFAAAALRIKGVPGAAALGPAVGAGLWVKDLLTAGRPGPLPKGWTLEWADTFDGRFDGFWHDLTRRNPGRLLGGRSRAELAWHFRGPARSRGLWVATLQGPDRAFRGYAVFKRQDHGPSGLTRARMVDYQVLDPDPAIDPLPGLIAAAARRCARDGVAALERVGCDLPRTAAFDGLAPYRRDLPAWSYYYKANDRSVAAALADPGAWDPSSFDGDASL